MIRRSGTVWWALVVSMAAMVGCQGQARPELSGEAVPADFTIELVVVQPVVHTGEDPLEGTSRYLLEADRTLRIALGQGAVARTHPKRTLRLSPTQVEILYRLVCDAGLVGGKRASDETARLSNEAGFDLVIMANRRRYRVTGSLMEQPEVAELWNQLRRAYAQSRGETVAG